MNSSDGEPSSSDDECARNMELVMKHQKITANVLGSLGFWYVLLQFLSEQISKKRIGCHWL
jgi:hypothetical protein